MTDYISDCCGAGYFENCFDALECKECMRACNTIRADAPVLVKLKEKLARVEALACRMEEECGVFGPHPEFRTATARWSVRLRQALEEP